MSGFANNFGMNGSHSAAAASLWQPRQFGAAAPGVVSSSSSAAAAHHQAAAAAQSHHGHQDSRVAEKLVSELQVSLSVCLFVKREVKSLYVMTKQGVLIEPKKSIFSK